MKRLIALFLAFMIMLNSLPLQVFADNTVFVDTSELTQNVIYENSTEMTEKNKTEVSEEVVQNDIPQEEKAETEVTAETDKDDVVTDEAVEQPAEKETDLLQRLKDKILKIEKETDGYEK